MCVSASYNYRRWVHCTDTEPTRDCFVSFRGSVSGVTAPIVLSAVLVEMCSKREF